jgi:thioesterase domain-containing protein
MMKFLDTKATNSVGSNALPTAQDVHVFPTTLAQRRFWQYDQSDPGNPSYNIAIRIRLAGELAYPCLRRAVDEVLRRHEMLRTVFGDDDGEPVQLVLPELTIPVTLVDLSDLGDEARSLKAEAMALDEARTRFDLRVGPLIRMKLLLLAPHEHVLFVTVHQMISDCWSIGTLSHEIGILYGSFSRGLESPLPELPIQYGDYAVWQKQWLEHHGLEGQLSYWTERLANLQPLEIPPDRPRPPRRTSHGDIRSVLLPQALTEALKELSHQEGCTFFMLSLAALNVLLTRLTSQTDVYVGTITAGRSRVEMEPLIGRFINPLVVRSDVSGNPTFLSLLAHVRERVLEALENRDVPYECVVEALAPVPDPSRHPVFQVNFVHQRAFVRPIELSSLRMSGLPSKSAGAIYDIYVFMVERSEGWRLSCEYNTDLYEADTIDRIMEGFRSILDAIARDPDRAISDLSSPPASGSSGVSPSVPALATIAPRPFVAPRDEVEAKLAKIWCDVIQTDRISVTSDFFDEGGHSVLAARVLYRVERVFGRDLSFGAFLRAPTIETFARRLREEYVEEEREQVCVIQRGSSSMSPLFLVDAGYSFLALAECLGDDRPVKGLILPPIATLPKAFTVQDLAENLLRALLEAQPRGPYYLGGWCSAGIIAYEIAQRLRARGEHVALLALIDAWNPAYSRRLRSPRSLPTRVRMNVYKLKYHASKVKGMNARTLTKYAGKRLRAIGDDLRMRFWRLWYRRLNRPAGPSVRHRGEFKNIAALDYDPRPLDAPILLFRAELFQGCHLVDARHGWGDLAAAGLTVHDIPGDHGAMLFDEPYVRLLGAALGQNLDRPIGATQTGEVVTAR